MSSCSNSRRTPTTAVASDMRSCSSTCYTGCHWAWFHHSQQLLQENICPWTVQTMRGDAAAAESIEHHCSCGLLLGQACLRHHIIISYSQTQHSSY